MISRKIINRTKTVILLPSNPEAPRPVGLREFVVANPAQNKPHKDKSPITAKQLAECQNKSLFQPPKLSIIDIARIALLNFRVSWVISPPLPSQKRNRITQQNIIFHSPN